MNPDDLVDVLIDHRPSDQMCLACHKAWPCLPYRLATRTLIAEVRLDARPDTPAYLFDYDALVNQLRDGMYDDDDGRGTE